MTGPYFDELHTGQVFAGAPAMTLTPGLAAVHQSILGDRLRLPLDTELSAAVTKLTAPLAHPGLVCDVAIGQSTLVTQHVKANLFYRGLVFYRFPAIGDALFTRTEVVGLKKNAAKPGRAPTGLVALRMTTIDQADRLILDFYRCAMLPLSPGAGPDDTPTTCRRSVPIWPRRRRLSTSGTATHSVSASPDRISIPIWRARCYRAVPMWSAVHQNWPA
jgi:acyl dehydratase